MTDAETTGPGGATKLCPYCAETIKAAAIKCRYCHSDLDPADPPVVAEDKPADPPVVAEDKPADPPLVAVSRGASAARGSRRPPGRLAWLLAAATAFVVLVLLAVAAWQWQKASEIEEARQAGRTARAAVSEKVETLLTYEHSTFDESFAAAEKVMTDSFLEEYTPTMETIRDRAVEQQRSQQAEVIAVSVISQSADEVETLLFVDTVSSREGAEEQRLLQNRVKVTLVREGDTWLIDDLDVPQS